MISLSAAFVAKMSRSKIDCNRPVPPDVRKRPDSELPPTRSPAEYAGPVLTVMVEAAVAL